MEPKKVSESRSIATQLVLPRDSNSRWGLYGGKLVDWIDSIGTVVAMRHCNRRVVTASIESLDFLSRVNLGDIVIMEGWVNHTGNTSMEVEVKVDVENWKNAEKRHACNAILTYVAIDDNGTPVEIPPLELTTDAEKKRWRAAEKRKKAKESCEE